MRGAAGAFLLAGVSLLMGQASSRYKGIEEKLPVEVAPQPVPFSHKQHLEAGPECQDCHQRAATSDYAGLPKPGRCMLCHQAIKTGSPAIRKLAKLAGEGGKVKWVRVYRVPDFVFFSHKNHLAAGEKCGTCHGPVAQRDVLAKEVSTSMTTCMNCHAARKVSNECHFCHALGF